jgi:disulfide bond formation protein DsbB
MRFTLNPPMNNETFELFFAMLSVALLAGTVVVLIARLLAGSQAWAASTIAAFRIVNYKPCRLCWFQRTMMYPLAIILIIAALRKDWKVKFYAVPLAVIGAVIASYHWLLERFPNIESGVCDVEVPCEFVWFELFGFVTLPFMALTAFVAVIVFTTLPTQPTEQ